MDWDLDAGTEPDAVPEPQHGWTAEEYDPDLSAGGYGSDDSGPVYDEDHNVPDGPVEPIGDEEEPDTSGHSRALPVDTDGDGDYDRVLVDRDGDGDYDRALPYGDDGPGRR